MSSASYIHGRDVPKLLLDWLQQLATEQKANDERQRAVISANTAKLVTRELVKRGISAHWPVHKAIARLKEAQVVGDTPELAIAMHDLPPQWQLYNIMLQEAAPKYFKAHSVATANFTACYFDQITFLTLWNDVWRNHFHIATGGNGLKLLNDIRDELMTVPDMNKEQRDVASRATLASSAGDMFHFSAKDLETITATAKEVLERQQAEESGITEELGARMQQAFDFYSWIKELDERADQTISGNTSTDGFIVENSETAPIQDIKDGVRHYFTHIQRLTKEALQLEQTHEQMRDMAKNQLDKEWTLFEAGLNDPTEKWQNAYRSYILAYTEWARALQMNEMFNAMRERQEDRTFENIIPCPDSMLQLIHNAVNNGLLDSLRAQMENTKKQFLESEADVRQHAMHHDRARYVIHIQENFRSLVRLDGKVDRIIQYLNAPNTTTDLDRKIDMDSKQSFATGNLIYCKAFMALKSRKAQVRKSLLDQQSISHVYPHNQVVLEASEACLNIKKLITEELAKEPDTQQLNVCYALIHQRKPITQLGSELFKRPLQAVYTQQAKQALSAPFRKITELDLLDKFVEQKLLPDNQTTTLNPMEASMMQSYATENHTSAFGEIIRYAAWLMWVLHKEKISMGRRPLTTGNGSDSDSDY